MRKNDHFSGAASYAQSAFADFAGATPVATQVQCATEQAPIVLADLSASSSQTSYVAISAVAAKAEDGSLLISVVNRGTEAMTHVQLCSLSAETPWAVNTFQQTGVVKPSISKVPVSSRSVALDIRAYSVLCLHLSREK